MCMYVCLYVCIDSSARRPNHTLYDKKTAVVSNFRSSGYEAKREQLTEVWEVSERNLGRKRSSKTLRASARNAVFRTSHFMCARRPKSKLMYFRRFWQREGSGSGPTGPREAVRGGSGRGPTNALNGFDVVLYPSYVRIGPATLKKCVNRSMSGPISGQNWQITVSF